MNVLKIYFLLILAFCQTYCLSQSYGSSTEEGQQLINEAYQQSEFGDYEKSIRTTQRALNYLPESQTYLRSMAYDNIGFAYYRLKDTVSALKAYNRALEINPHNGLTRYNLGTVFFDQKKYESAERCFELAWQTIDGSSSDGKRIMPYVLAYWGDCQRNLGKYKEAEQKYLMSIEKNETSQACLGLADLYYAKDQWENAAEYYERGIAFEPERSSNARRNYSLGVCYANIMMQNLDNEQKAVAASTKLTKAMQKCIKLNEEILFLELMYKAKTGYWLKDGPHDEIYLAAVSISLWSLDTKARVEQYNRLLGDEDYRERFYSVLYDSLYARVVEDYRLVGEYSKANTVLSVGLNRYPNSQSLLKLKSGK